MMRSFLFSVFSSPCKEQGAVGKSGDDVGSKGAGNREPMAVHTCAHWTCDIGIHSTCSNSLSGPVLAIRF